jgi:polar amino acid transport system substrate-binding protein
LKVTKDSLTPLYYNSFALKYGSPKWQAWLNEFLFDLNATGKNAELYQKWFGSPLPFKLNPQY